MAVLHNISTGQNFMKLQIEVIVILDTTLWRDAYKLIRAAPHLDFVWVVNRILFKAESEARPA